MPTAYSWKLFWSVEFLMQIGSAFVKWKVFVFNVFCLHLAVHLDKQVAIPCFLNSFLSSPWRNNIFYEERREFCEAGFLQRFNNNESEEVCCLILWPWFSLVWSGDRMANDLQLTTWSDGRFLSSEDAIYGVYLSLALRSTTHHGVQLLSGMNQGENPFALVETEIRDQYTRTEGSFQIPILSTHLTLGCHFLAPNRKELGICCKCRFKSTVGIKQIGARTWHDQSNRPSDQVVSWKSLSHSDHSDQWVLTHQDSVLAYYGSPPTANSLAPLEGGLTPLQGSSQRILQPHPTEQLKIVYYKNN